MNPESRTGWALGISLIIWLPVAFGIIGGHIELSIGGLYYLGALGIAWVGTGVIVNITSGYRASIDNIERTKQQIELLEQQSREAAQYPRRRDNDRGNQSTQDE